MPQALTHEKTGCPVGFNTEAFDLHFSSLSFLPKCTTKDLVDPTGTNSSTRSVGTCTDIPRFVQSSAMPPSLSGFVANGTTAGLLKGLAKRCARGSTSGARSPWVRLVATGGKPVLPASIHELQNVNS